MNTDVHDENPDAPRGIAPYTPESDTGDASDVVVDVIEITKEPASPTSPTSVDTVTSNIRETLMVHTNNIRETNKQTVERECSRPPSPGETTVSNKDIMASLLRLHTAIDALHNSMQFRPYEREQSRFEPFVGGWSQPPVPDPAHTHGRGGARARGGGGRGRNSRRTPANYAYADTDC